MYYQGSNVTLLVTLFFSLPSLYWFLGVIITGEVINLQRCTISSCKACRKLDFYGKSKPLSWFQLFFNNQQQNVEINGGCSSSCTVASKVLQGLSAIFLLYINNLTENIRSSVRLFADDCLIHHTAYYTSIRKN